jgi:predicted DNA repair protein MutK
MVGGAFLCFEGCEKLAHKFLHSTHEDEAEHESHAKANANPAVDMAAFEKDKVKGAVRTDFILSAEIIAITLGAVAGAPFAQQVAVLVGIAVLMTLGVYGLVAGIVKLDDLGLWLSGRASSAARALGRGIVAAAPWLMKGLSVAGTAAMFLVGGGIVVHGVPALHHAVEAAGQAAAGAWPLGGLWAAVLPHVLNALAGMAVGAAVLAAWTLLGRLRGR